MSAPDSDPAKVPHDPPIGEDTSGVADSPLLGGLTGRRRLLLLAALPFLLVGVALLVTKLLGEDALLESVREADPRWLAVCVLGEALAFVGYVTVFREAAAIDRGPRLRPRTALHVVLTALGATRLLAAGGAGGLAVFFWALRRSGVRARRAAAKVLGLNVFLFVVFGLIGWIAALAVLIGERGAVPLVLTISWLAGGPAALVALLSIAAPAWRVWRPPEGWPAWLRGLLSSVPPGIALAWRMVRRRGRVVLPGGLVYWAGDLLCLVAALRAFSLDLPIEAAALAYATGYLATLLPLPTGAEGGVEAATIAALVALGGALAPALLAVVVFRLFSFWLPTIPALLTLPTLPRLARALEQAGDDRERAARAAEGLAPSSTRG